VVYGDNLSGVFTKSVTDAANYILTPLTGGKPGQFRVTSITEKAGKVKGTEDVTITFNGGKLIKGGNFLFTILAANAGNAAGVQDLAENGMQGAFTGKLPSGNGANGTNFVAELTAFHNQVRPPASLVATTVVKKAVAHPKGPKK
jgi:hypothetical protein